LTTTSPRNEYLDGFRLALENANRLFTAAETLERENELPIASSLLVLAAEEGIKAVAILMQYFFPGNDIKGFKKSFEDHTYKLETIRGVVAFSKITQMMVDLFYVPVYESLEKSEEERARVNDQAFQNLLNWFKEQAGSKSNDLLKQSKWWKSSKNIKEAGFYVGIDEKKKRWIKPTASKQSYRKTKEYVAGFLSQINVMRSIDFKAKDGEMISQILQTSMQKFQVENAARGNQK
jgi:AbiV family abortive infection protein